MQGHRLDPWSGNQHPASCVGQPKNQTDTQTDPGQAWGAAMWVFSLSHTLALGLKVSPPFSPFYRDSDPHILSECQSVSGSVLSDSAIPQTAAHQAPLSMGFPRQESCCGLPFPSPGDLPDPGIKPGCPVLPADSLPPEPPGQPSYSLLILKNLYF